jgi:DNA-binding transcriptional MerR regulator
MLPIFDSVTLYCYNGTMKSPNYDLKELCEAADVTPRTVHFYIQVGLLPGAGVTGPGAKYGAEHLSRIRLIKLLQREHLPLAEIRQHIEPLDQAQVERLLKEHESKRKPPPSSAVDYIRGVLEGRSTTEPQPTSQQMGSPAQTQARHFQPGTERSQWERISLCPDVEVHVRRPLSRDQNRRLEKLISFARELFKEDSYDS